MPRLACTLALTLPLLLPACDTGKGGTTDSGTTDGGTAVGDGTTGDAEVTEGPQTSSAASVTITGATDPGPTSGPTGGQTVTSANPTTDPGATTTANPTTDPGATTTANPTTETTGGADDPWEAARQRCVDEINMYRGTLGLPAYQRWFDAEVCADAEALGDGQMNKPHGTFGMCGESAQNECPGYGGPVEMALVGCLAQMWAEGPGEDFNKHGHYINMSSEQYSKVACGFADLDGSLWMVQDFQ